MLSMVKRVFYGVLAGLCLQSAPLFSAQKPLNIICDLGGVLMTTKKSAAFSHLGLLRILLCYISTWPYNRPAKQLLFETLDSIKPRNEEEVLACDESGKLLPQYMCDWMKGAIHPQSILEHVNSFTYENSSLFSSTAEHSLFQRLASLVFNPELLATTQMLIPEGVAFIEECKNQGCNVYLLSNWDPYSFDLLQEKHSEFFALFDGVTISGQCGYIKPDPRIYQHLLKTHGLKAEDCLFLDDRIENVIAAQQLGIKSVLIEKQSGILGNSPDFSSAYNELEQPVTA